MCAIFYRAISFLLLFLIYLFLCAENEYSNIFRQTRYKCTGLVELCVKATVNYRDAANSEEYQLAYRGELTIHKYGIAFTCNVTN